MDWHWQTLVIHSFVVFGVNFTLNSVFIPISTLCLAKMSCYSTRISSIACFSISVRSASVQSNHLRKLFRNSVLSCGLSFSLSFSSFNSLRILVCIGLVYDPQAFQDFQVLGTRMCFLAARVFSF